MKLIFHLACQVFTWDFTSEADACLAIWNNMIDQNWSKRRITIIVLRQLCHVHDVAIDIDEWNCRKKEI